MMTWEREEVAVSECPCWDLSVEQEFAFESGSLSTWFNFYTFSLFDHL